MAWALDYGEVDCKEAPLGVIETREILIRMVVIRGNTPLVHIHLVIYKLCLSLF